MRVIFKLLVPFKLYKMILTRMAKWTFRFSEPSTTKFFIYRFNLNFIPSQRRLFLSFDVFISFSYKNKSIEEAQGLP